MATVTRDIGSWEGKSIRSCSSCGARLTEPLTSRAYNTVGWSAEVKAAELEHNL